MNPKEIRKQIRNVLESDGAPEAIKVALAEAEKLTNSRLDSIEQKCLARLEEIHTGMNDQIKEINRKNGMLQSYVIGQVKGELQQMIGKNEDSISALLEILAESGLSVADLPSKVAERIPAVREKKAAEAAAAMQARLEAERANAEQASSNEQAPA